MATLSFRACSKPSSSAFSRGTPSPYRSGPSPCSSFAPACATACARRWPRLPGPRRRTSPTRRSRWSRDQPSSPRSRRCSLPARLLAAAMLLVLAARQLRSVDFSGTAREPAGSGRTYATVLGLTLLNPATVIYYASLAIGLPAISGELAARVLFAAGAARTRATASRRRDRDREQRDHRGPGPEDRRGRARGLDPRPPLRSSNRRESVLRLPLSRQNRLHRGLPDRPRPELDVEPSTV